MSTALQDLKAIEEESKARGITNHYLLVRLIPRVSSDNPKDHVNVQELSLNELYAQVVEEYSGYAQENYAERMGIDLENGQLSDEQRRDLLLLTFFPKVLDITLKDNHRYVLLQPTRRDTYRDDVLGSLKALMTFNLITQADIAALQNAETALEIADDALTQLDGILSQNSEVRQVIEPRLLDLMQSALGLYNQEWFVEALRLEKERRSKPGPAGLAYPVRFWAIAEYERRKKSEGITQDEFIRELERMNIEFPKSSFGDAYREYKALGLSKR